MVEVDSGSEVAGKCGLHGGCQITYRTVRTQIWYTQLGKTAYMNGATYNYSEWPTPGGGTLLNTQAGGNYYLHKDWLGSARIVSSIPAGGNGTVITDQAFAPYGEVYDIFGVGDQNQVNFTGLTQDVLAGMYDTPNRELQGATQGRWLSPDPAGSGWNQYAYATNPLIFTDPTGLFITGPLLNLYNASGQDFDNCNMDGLTTPCSTVYSSLAGGAAVQCPNNVCFGVTADNRSAYFWASTNGPGSYYTTSGPGALYYSANQAGIAAVQNTNPTSIQNNKEYSGNIYLDQNGVYSYTAPNLGGSAHSPYDPSAIPDGTTYAGNYHDHGAFALFSDENFSPPGCNGDPTHLCDIGLAMSPVYNPGANPFFLGTPQGRVEVFYPSQSATFPMGCVLVGLPVMGGFGAQPVPSCQ
jgi:RHS repeat-associated protein